MTFVRQFIVLLAFTILYKAACVDSHSDDVKILIQRLEQVEEKVQNQELMYGKRISDLERDNKAHERTIATLLNIVIKQNHSRSGSQDQREHFVDEMANSVITGMSGNANRLERNLIPPTTAQRHVAFHARLSMDITHINVGQNIAFDHVILDTGNAYNSNIGVFTVPFTGVYVFYWNLLTNKDSQMDTTLFSTQGKLGYGYVDKGDDGYANGGNMVIALLNEGSRVFLKKADKYGEFLHERYSTFSGFLLYDLS